MPYITLRKISNNGEKLKIPHAISIKEEQQTQPKANTLKNTL